MKMRRDNEMKVIILAGGWGTRLGRQSEDIPKPMVPIGNRPVLWHIMKIYSFHRHTDFIISCGVKAHIIKDYFANYRTYTEDFSVDFGSHEIRYHNTHGEQNWKVTVVDTGLNTLKGARIKRVEKFMNDEVNMIAYGDGVADIDISKLIEFHNSHGKTITITGVHPPARFGELIEENSRVRSFEEKPQTSVGLINGGFMVFNRNLLEHLTRDENCDLETGAISELTKAGEVMVYKHNGQWECMDHERDVIHLNKLWNEENAFWKVW